MSHAHLLTGATGFVGSYLLIELLRQTDVPIVCLVRPSEVAPYQRLQHLMHELIDLYGLESSLRAAFEQRCIVVAGDILDSPRQLLASIRSATALPIEQIWHTAASLNYEERFAEQIYQINCEGTSSLLALASLLETAHFNHFSTAYVAGTRLGTVMEDYIPDPTLNANAYERSKTLGEQAVEAAYPAVNTRIFRPSIVVGHSQTLGAFNFSGLYGFTRRLHQFKKIMQRINRGYLNSHPIRVVADPAAQINYVCVDKLAFQAVKIGLSDSTLRHFHLTSESSPTVEFSLNTVFTQVGLPLPTLISEPSALNWIDQEFNQKIEFYSAYLGSSKRFDRTHVYTLLGDECRQQDGMSNSEFVSHVDWYVQTQLNATLALRA